MRNWIMLFKFFVLIIITTIQTLLGVKKIPIVVTFESAVYSCFGITFFVVKWTCIVRRGAIAELYNLFLRFEKNYFRAREKLRLGRLERKIFKTVQWIGINLHFVGVPSYTIHRFLTPCWPATLGYFLNPECVSSKSKTIWFAAGLPILKFLFLAIPFWLYMDMVGSFQFQMGQLSLIQCCSLIQYLKYFKRTLVNRCCDLKLFRELQILSQFFNIIYHDVVHVSFIFLVMIAFTGSFYVFVKFGFQITFPLLLLFIAVWMDGFIGITVVLGMFAKLHQNSKEVLVFIKEKVIPGLSGRKERLRFGKILNSFSSLKVRIGDVNYVDQLTPLRVVEFCCEQLVSTLLL